MAILKAVQSLLIGKIFPENVLSSILSVLNKRIFNNFSDNFPWKFSHNFSYNFSYNFSDKFSYNFFLTFSDITDELARAGKKLPNSDMLQGIGIPIESFNLDILHLFHR